MTGAATLVVDEAVTRLEALAMIATAVGAPVDAEGTSRASVALSPSTRARVEIPGFGEAPPLAIDVTSVDDDADARDAALVLAERLRDLGWRVAPAF